MIRVLFFIAWKGVLVHGLSESIDISMNAATWTWDVGHGVEV